MNAEPSLFTELFAAAGVGLGVASSGVRTLQSAPQRGFRKPPLKTLPGHRFFSAEEVYARTDIAINMLAARTPRDYTAPRAKFGRRFDPLDTDDLEPVPLGLMGPIHLVEERNK